MTDLPPGARHRTGTSLIKTLVTGGSAVWESVEPLTETMQKWPNDVCDDREGAGSSPKVRVLLAHGNGCP